MNLSACCWIIVLRVETLPQAAQGMQPSCGLKSGTEEYSGTIGSFPNGLINRFGNSVTGTLAVMMLGIRKRRKGGLTGNWLLH